MITQLTPSHGIQTISLSCAEPLCLDKFNTWVSELLRTLGDSFYRLKGILHMKGYNQTFVAHGIHMVFDGELGPMWETSVSTGNMLHTTTPHPGNHLPVTEHIDSLKPIIRVSKLVLIGVNIDPTGKLVEDFLSCRAT